MSKKKKVTAPLTYNPGKGRPKEHLAYLNYQEMQALKRLNGNNQERGPKGLPSFPPADAKGSSSKASSTGARGPTGPQGQARSSPAGNKGGAPGSATRTSTTTGARGPTGPQGQARTSPAGGSPGAVSRPSGLAGIGGGGGGGARDSGQAATRNVTTSRSVTPSRAPSIPSGGGGRDSGTIRQAQDARTKAAEKTPALKDDRSRTLNVGPMGTPVQVKAQPGAKIRGAIQSVKDLGIAGVPGGMPRVVVPAATVTTQQMRNLYSQYQQPPSPTPTKTQIAEQLRRTYPDRWGKYSLSEVENAVDKLAQSLPGEADINKYSAASMRNLAQVGINQVVRNLTPEQMLKAIDTTGMDIKRGTQEFAYPGPRSMGMTGNWADQNLAKQSYETAMRSIESAIENKGVAPQARNATNFVAAGTPMVKDVRAVGSPVYGTQFGIDPIAQSAVERRNRLADMKRDYAQYRTPGSDVSIVPASATPGREAVPGLISYPKLDRPQPTRKPIQDRITPEYPRISSDPTNVGRRFEERNKQIYDRILSEQGAENIGVRGESLMGIGAAAFGGGRITPLDGGVTASGTVGGKAGYSSDVVRDVYAGSVLPSSMRSATGAIADLPGAARTPVFGSMRGATALAGNISIPPKAPTAGRGTVPPTTAAQETERMQRIAEYARLSQDPTAQGRFVPAGGMSFRGMPNQMFEGAAVPNRPYGISLPERTGNIAKSSFPTINPTLNETVLKGAYRETISPEERLAMDALYRERMNVPAPGEEVTLEVETVPEEISGIESPVYGDIGDVQYPEKTLIQKGAERLPYGVGIALKVANWVGRKEWDSMTTEERLALIKQWERKNAEYLRGGTASSGRDTGIASLVGTTPSAGSETPAPPSSQPTPSGRRPDIYYMWDLGVNIPSPGDPNYTQYQTYLAERLAAQRAMGYI
jgi:hypothetical protein